ncbi:hypothetical protein SSX86_019779 [Deinandra increscens subsp. villosa]|uniref:Uncharacterized protein n=1 Tax=Deinandra increscens subsp. villosa TaxID=3103831 RepID=A0AAP0CT96_9ASTR
MAASSFISSSTSLLFNKVIIIYPSSISLIKNTCLNSQFHFSQKVAGGQSSQPLFQISISNQKKANSSKILAVMTPKTTSDRQSSTTGSVGFFSSSSSPLCNTENFTDFIDLVKTGMTMTEKIFAGASERSQLSPGENVWVNVDVLMTHDVCGPGSIGVFKKEFGDHAKVTF